MTKEEVGGSIRYGVGIDAEEHVIGSFDPLHLAGSTDCLRASCISALCSG